ncbi:Imm3 family immunity protein [Paenibacillus sp. NPDC058071]|uniref:Imm3 family immunity protein n=1 Tax=Paenibacillus sp. NPDC058071 TaxID=3346326 RepID=UPI0036DF0A7B
MVEELTYDELMEYVPNDYTSFVSDGLSPGQAISRLVVEYENQTDDYEEINWLFTVISAEICVRNNCIREHIVKHALEIIEDKRLISIWKKEKINFYELNIREQYLENVRLVIKDKI